MRNQFKFWWRCIRHAWRGCWTRANELAGVLGAILLAIAVWASWPYMTAKGWVEAPTTYEGVAALTAASAVASLALAFVLIFVTRFIFAPANLYREEQIRAEELNENLRRTNRERPPDAPNWPIHELFSHLEPDALDQPKRALWEDASLKIRDAASLGQLRIWGRLFKTELGKWIGERAALREIDKAYWQKAFFTYWFFDETAGDNAAHCYADRDSGVPAYTDLQVNREEVLRIWPGEADDISDSYPNVRIADTPALIQLFESSARPKLMALLAAGKLKSWARLGSSGQKRDLIKLEGEIWNSHTFQFLPKDGDDRINQTFLQAKGYSSHYDVCMNYAELKRVWPDLSIQRTDCSMG